MRPERVVVGYDGSAASRRALAWAVRHAPGAVVLMVTAWSPDARHAARLGTHRSRLRDSQREAMSRALSCLAPARRPVVVGSLVMADPVTALAHAAELADLVVVGAADGAEIRAGLAGELARRLAGHPRHEGGTCPLRVIR